MSDGSANTPAGKRTLAAILGHMQEQDMATNGRLVMHDADLLPPAVAIHLAALAVAMLPPKERTVEGFRRLADDAATLAEMTHAAALRRWSEPDDDVRLTHEPPRAQRDPFLPVPPCDPDPAA